MKTKSRQPNWRWMIRRDMEEVVAIEAASFSEPWELEDYLQFLRKRNCIGHVIESDDVVLGAMLYTLNPKHLHVERLVVHPSDREHRNYPRIDGHESRSMLTTIRWSSVAGSGTVASER